MIPAKYWSPTKKLMVLGAMAGGKLVEDTVTGNPLVFITDKAKPLKRLSLSLLPRQSGTGDPSPSNIRPLLPWDGLTVFHAGKNLLDSAVFGLASDNYSVSNGIITVKKSDDRAWTSVAEIDFPAGTYTISRSNVQGRLTVKASIDNYDSAFVNTTNDSATFTLSADCKIKIKLSGSSGAYPYDTTLQIEVGNTATAYVPYTPITPHPVNLQANLFNTGNAIFPYTNNGILFTRNQDGSVTVQRVESSTGNGVMFLMQGGTAEKPLFPSGQYTWTGFPVDSGFTSINTVLQLTITEKATGTVYQRRQLRINKSTDTFTVTDDYYISDIFIRIDKSETATATFKPMLEVGDTPTAFQPYLPPVYGAYLDLTTGEVWGTWVAITGKWGDAIQKTSLGDFTRGILRKQNAQLKYNGGGVSAKCNIISVRKWSYSEDSLHYYADNGSNYIDFTIFLPNDTPQETEIQGIFELATPVLLATLTPQQVNALVGVNMVWSDADGVEVTYLKKG